MTYTVTRKSNGAILYQGSSFVSFVKALYKSLEYKIMEEEFPV